MKKFIALIFLACVLLSLIAVSAAPADEQTPDVSTLNKRNSCPHYKRDVLGKRTNKHCPCATAYAVFDPNHSPEYYSTGPAKGLVIYSQDECGMTTVSGQYSKGFDDPNLPYKFTITDFCDKLICDLTSELNVKFTNGGTKPFRHTFSGFNLNCDIEGILLTQSQSCVQRGARMNVDVGSTHFSQAGIEEV